MATGKSKKILKVKFVSTGLTEAKKPTGTFYTKYKSAMKNPKKKGTATGGKLKLKKFDRRAFNEKTGKNGMHVEFREEKI